MHDSNVRRERTPSDLTDGPVVPITANVLAVVAAIVALAIWPGLLTLLVTLGVVVAVLAQTMRGMNRLLSH